MCHRVSDVVLCSTRDHQELDKMCPALKAVSALKWRVKDNKQLNK